MERGEFEAGPVQTQPSVVVKRKSNPAVLAMAIIFALISVGLGVWIVILLNNPKGSESKTSKNETSQEQTVESGNGEASTPATPASARIGYSVWGHCTVGYLTKGGEFYVSTADACDSMWKDQTPGINKADAATGQNGTFTLTYGAGKDLAEYEVAGATTDKITVNGLKVNDSNIVAVATAEIGQNWTGEKYVLVKEDGTIDMLLLDADATGKLNPKLVKNFGGFKNIASAVSVDNGDYVSTVLITRNGGQISMTDALNGLYTDND